MVDYLVRVPFLWLLDIVLTALASVHSGKTADGKDLTEFDPEGYRSTWMKHFCKYLLATPEGTFTFFMFFRHASQLTCLV